MLVFLRRCAALWLLCVSAQAQNLTLPPAAATAPPESAPVAAAAPAPQAPTAPQPEARPAEKTVDAKPAEQLEPVEVRAQRDAMSKAEEKLRRLKESLPDLGDDGKPKDSLGEKVREKVFNTVKNDNDPNKRSTEGKQFMNKVLDPLNPHAGDAPATQTQDDFKDVYCGTGECAH